MTEPREPIRITVIGAGYVGLTTSACFASLGHRVVCVDTDAERVDSLRSGIVPFHEPGLDDLVRSAIAADRLLFAADPATAVAGSRFVFICVPTPQFADGSADISFVRAVAATIRDHLDPDTIVINKSTVPIGSADIVESLIGRDDIHIASNPEFLCEGTALTNFFEPDRIVIGASDRWIASCVAELYATIDAPLIVTDRTSAETIKYAANAYLATRLSYANAIATLCEHLGADVVDVLAGMGADRRIGTQFLTPGPGWGGSCFPKDTRALIAMATEVGFDFSLLDGAIRSNEDQFDRIAAKVARLTSGSVAGARISVLGLAFKAGTDDLRGSPSLAIIERLVAHGALVTAHDPVVRSIADPSITLCDDPYEACTDADAIVVLTEWPEFALLDPVRLATIVADRNILDARNLLDAEAFRSAGFVYDGVGRS